MSLDAVQELASSGRKMDRQVAALVLCHAQALHVFASPRGDGKLEWAVCRSPSAGQPRGHGPTLADAVDELLEQERRT